MPQTRYLLNGCATVKGNVTSGGQPVFINCRDTKMNNFTSSAHLAESTFLIYVQINAAEKNNLKGKKEERGEAIYRACRAFFTAEFMIPVSKRGSRDKRSIFLSPSSTV